MFCSCNELLVEGPVSFDCPVVVVYGDEESEICFHQNRGISHKADTYLLGHVFLRGQKRRIR